VLPHPRFRGEETSPIPVPAKCHGRDFLPIPIPVRGIIPVGFSVSTLVHISLYDVNYSHSHEFILMIYKYIPFTKIQIWDWENKGLWFQLCLYIIIIRPCKYMSLQSEIPAGTETEACIPSPSSWTPTSIRPCLLVGKDFRYCSTFVCLWQILSNHRLIKVKRFISWFIGKLCN